MVSVVDDLGAVPSDDLRILCWNTHSWRVLSGHANVAAVAALIGETSPDIVSLTEVDEARTDARRIATLTDGLTEPWLICGDFNTAASSRPGHDRAVVVSPAKPAYPADEPAEPIDYCVASAAFRLDAENHGRTLFAAEPDVHPKGDDVKIYSAAEHLIGHTRTAERAANGLITARVAALRGRRV